MTTTNDGGAELLDPLVPCVEVTVVLAGIGPRGDRGIETVVVPEEPADVAPEAVEETDTDTDTDTGGATDAAMELVDDGEVAAGFSTADLAGDAEDGLGTAGDGNTGTTTTTEGELGFDESSGLLDPVPERRKRSSSASTPSRVRTQPRRRPVPFTDPRSGRSIHPRLGRCIPGCGERILTPWTTPDVLLCPTGCDSAP